MGRRAKASNDFSYHVAKQSNTDHRHGAISYKSPMDFQNQLN